MPVEKIVVTEGDKSQDVYIACTEEEAKDKSYMDYLKEGTEYKTKDQLKHKPEKEKPQYGKEHATGALKEYSDWKRRSDNGLRRKYF